MLTGRSDEPVGDEHEGAVGEGDALGSPEVLVEDRPEAELVEQGPDDEDRPPGRRHRPTWGAAGSPGSMCGVAGEEPAELGEDLDEEVLASEVGDDALLDLAVLAVGFDDADVFVDGAVLEERTLTVLGYMIGCWHRWRGDVRRRTAIIITTILAKSR